MSIRRRRLQKGIDTARHLGVKFQTTLSWLEAVITLERDGTVALFNEGARR